MQYYDALSPESTAAALAQLEAYLEAEGPFDGVIGYSQGATLAATYLIRFAQRRHPAAAAAAAAVPLPFKCAVFFSGGRPVDPRLLDRGELRLIDPAELPGPLLPLPTAGIWGRNDALWPGGGEALWRLCDPAARVRFVHDEGHDIPGSRARDAVAGAVGAIRRTIDRAAMAH